MTLEVPRRPTDYYQIRLLQRTPRTELDCLDDRDEIDPPNLDSDNEDQLATQVDDSVRLSYSDISNDTDDVTPIDARQLHHDLDIEQQPTDQLGTEERALLPVSILGPQIPAKEAFKLFVYPGKPPFVHQIVWKQLSAGTRKLHARWLREVANLPADMHRWSASKAAIEIVLRRAHERKWSWPTIASSLSALESALKTLPIYTTSTNGIDLTKDPEFTAAKRKAQYLAKTTATPRKCAPVDKQAFDALLRQTKSPGAWLLGQLSWALASRVGDTRQLRKADIIFTHLDDDRTELHATFRRGKGAFWASGPFTVTTIVAENISKRIIEWCRASPEGDHPLFSTTHQRLLSSAINSFGNGDCSLRSIRKGAILEAASAGVPDKKLMLLSGHGKLATLRRYLGWGLASATARQAAHERFNAIENRHLSTYNNPGPHTDDNDLDSEILGGYLLKMGTWSGQCGHRGKRIAHPLDLFSQRTPSHRDLGIAEPLTDSETWPLHVKNVPMLDWTCFERLMATTQIDVKTHDLRDWVESNKYYGVDTTVHIHPTDLPPAQLTTSQIETLLLYEKIAPYNIVEQGLPLSGVRAFAVPEPKKHRWRPIFETMLNPTAKLNIQRHALQYPSRLERRQQMRQKRWALHLDFAAWFDQISLSTNVAPYFVFRTSTPVKGNSLFFLKRLPMGATFAPLVAQYITWGIVEPFTRQASIEVATMLDNIRIASNDKTSFLSAARGLLTRIETLGAKLNESINSKTSDEDILKMCDTSRPDNECIFLGEVYSIQDETTCISNTTTNVLKLTQAIERIDQPDFTKRNFAAIVGLLIWMSETINIPLRDPAMFTILRAYCAITSAPTPWSSPIEISVGVRTALRAISARIIANPKTPIWEHPRPSTNANDYDTIIYVDACKTGFAAYAVHSIPQSQHRSETLLIRACWPSTGFVHSAHAEPKAATEVLRYLKQRNAITATSHVAIITDHRAMVSGQRQYRSGYKGFSTSGPLNEFFSELYDNTLTRRDVFYVEGELNPADGPSREVRMVQYIVATPVEINLPTLNTFWHPQLNTPETRKSYQV